MDVFEAVRSITMFHAAAEAMNGTPVSNRSRKATLVIGFLPYKIVTAKLRMLRG